MQRSLRGWSEAQKRAYVLADNKLAQNAGWDDDLLGLELGDLRMDGFDLPLIGFNEDAMMVAEPRWINLLTVRPLPSPSDR